MDDPVVHVHRLLAVPEIVRLIIRELDASSLAALARTRHSLFDVASQQLYETLRSQDLATIASRLLAYKPMPEPTVTARVDRFRQAYADHVVYVQVGSFDLPAQQKNIPVWSRLRRMIMIWPTDALFPNLRSLNCSADDPEQLETVLKLLVSSLEELVVAGCSLPIALEQDWNVPVGFLLMALPERCPRLRKLGLNVAATSTDHVNSLERALIKLDYLTALECDYVAYHPAVFTRIANLTKLKRLRIGWTVEFLWPHFDAVSFEDGPKFSSLQHLSLEGTCSVLQGVFNSIHSALVELDVGITLMKIDDRSALTALAADIQTLYPDLRDLHCRIMDASDQVDPEPHHPALLSSFLRFQHITRFGFSYNTSQSDQEHLVCFGDEDVIAMARAWPSLTDLRIDCPLAEPDSLTLVSLGELAENCKQLLFVQLPSISADDVPKPPSKGSPAHVICLNLKLSSLTNASTVALFLSAIWPNIRFLHSCAFCGQVKSLHEMMSYGKIMDRYEKGQAVPKSVIAHLSARYQTPFAITF